VLEYHSGRAVSPISYKRHAKKPAFAQDAKRPTLPPPFWDLIAEYRSSDAYKWDQSPRGF
jgi:hypothetical protein